MAFTPLQLKSILETKDGIFEKKDVDPQSGIIPLAILEQEFEREKTRIRSFSGDDVLDRRPNSMSQLTKIRNLSFDIDLMPISRIKENLKALKREMETSTSTLTHLAIYYGLSPTNRMILVMQGVNLDGSANGEKLDKKPPVSTRLQCTSANLDLRPASQLDARKSFKNTFQLIHGKNKFIWGTYLKVEPFITKLEKLEEEGCTQLKTTLAFLNPAPDPITGNQADLKCFHLVFSGLKADGQTPSTKVYTTYDHEIGYSGPKPSCPPFGETLE